MMEIFFGLFLGRPTSDDPDRIAADLSSLHPCSLLDPADPLRSLFERGARGLKEKRVAVPHRKCLPGRRCASVHDHRPRAAKWLRLAAFILRYLPAKSKSSRSDQIILMTSIHSCAYS